MTLITELEQRKQYIASLDLSGIPRPIVEMDAATEAGEVFDKAKEQAQVIGSAVLSFAKGVDEEMRKAISDSALLAELVADKRADAKADPVGWFTVYADVLKNIGWDLQEKTFDDYSSSGNAAEVHEKILEVMTAALGPSPAALAIIAATVKALKGMDPKSSWMRIWSREAQQAQIGRFQIGLVEAKPNGDAAVFMLACLMEAHQTITQILFFKWRDAHATFKARAGNASINRGSIKELHREIVEKTRAFQRSFMSSIQNL